MFSHWYLLTWTTYGSWLPGDERGFRTRMHDKHIQAPARYAGMSEAYNPDGWRRLFEYSRSVSKGVVILNERQQEFLRKRIPEIAFDGKCQVEALCVSDSHVHVVALIENDDVAGFVKRVKGVTSRELSGAGLPGRVWARGYHMRVIPESGLDTAIEYVLSQNPKRPPD